ncbi:TetR/AcrR family transcriptional regulator [Nocardioides sp. NPDC057577]|uniref:TetR/AcrR family transcriptional regulator n=1 Tax=Nocardioides sp. NPDC057577 TaxID=3346171 RepID=UPI003671B01E
MRERIFAAFAELMAEGSYGAISVSELAQRADIGLTGIYHHFQGSGRGHSRLVHSVLGTRNLPADRIEEFVLRAVGAL